MVTSPRGEETCLTSRNPKSITAAHELINEGEFQEAMPLLDVVLDTDPNNGPALNFSGYIAMRLHQDS